MALITRFSDNCYMDFDTGDFHHSDGSCKQLTQYLETILRKMTQDHLPHSRIEIMGWRWTQETAETGDICDRSVDDQIRLLRKLEPNLFPKLFLTVRGKGYRYVGPLQREEQPPPKEPKKPPATPRGMLVVVENSDWNNKSQPIVQNLGKDIPPERLVGAENADTHASHSGFHRKRTDMTLDEALDRLEEILGRVDCSQPPASQLDLLATLRAFFGTVCGHFKTAGDYQALHSLTYEGFAYFQKVPGAMAQEVCKQLEGWEFRLYVRMLELKIRLCEEGMDASKKANLLQEYQRFERQKEHYQWQLDEAYRVHNLTQQPDL